MKSLFAVKLVHTIIWVVMACATFYIFFSGLLNQITFLTWIATALIVGEGIVLLFYKWSCPLTGVARKYSVSTKENFDIFLPNWLAKYNKAIFTTIFIAGLLLIIIRKLTAD